MEAQPLSNGSYSQAHVYSDPICESVSARRPSNAGQTTEAQNKPVILVDTHFRIRSANRLFCERFGISPSIANGALLFRLGTGQWEQHGIRTMLNDALETGVKQECAVGMHIPGLGNCLVHLTAERRANYRPLDLIAITIEECVLAVNPAASAASSMTPDSEAVLLSRSVMSLSRGLYRELALIIGCAQAVLETGDAESRGSAAEIIAAARQIHGTHALLLLQARSLSQYVPVELVRDVLGESPRRVASDEEDLLPLPLDERIGGESRETAFLKAA